MLLQIKKQTFMNQMGGSKTHPIDSKANTVKLDMLKTLLTAQSLKK